jgi:hypothetical protein
MGLIFITDLGKTGSWQQIFAKNLQNETFQLDLWNQVQRSNFNIFYIKMKIIRFL